MGIRGTTLRELKGYEVERTDERSSEMVRTHVGYSSNGLEEVPTAVHGTAKGTRQ